MKQKWARTERWMNKWGHLPVLMAVTVGLAFGTVTNSKINGRLQRTFTGAIETIYPTYNIKKERDRVKQKIVELTNNIASDLRLRSFKNEVIMQRAKLDNAKLHGKSLEEVKIRGEIVEMLEKAIKKLEKELKSK